MLRHTPLNINHKLQYMEIIVNFTLYKNKKNYSSRASIVLRLKPKRASVIVSNHF